MTRNEIKSLISAINTNTPSNSEEAEAIRPQVWEAYESLWDEAAPPEGTVYAEDKEWASMALDLQLWLHPFHW